MNHGFCVYCKNLQQQSFITKLFAKFTTTILNIKFFKRDLNKAYNQKKTQKADKQETMLQKILWITVTSGVILALCYFSLIKLFLVKIPYKPS